MNVGGVELLLGAHQLPASGLGDNPSGSQLIALDDHLLQLQVASSNFVSQCLHAVDDSLLNCNDLRIQLRELGRESREVLEGLIFGVLFVMVSQ